jgi:hypothetical protein
MQISITVFSRFPAAGHGKREKNEDFLVSGKIKAMFVRFIYCCTV